MNDKVERLLAYYQKTDDYLLLKNALNTIYKGQNYESCFLNEKQLQIFKTVLAQLSIDYQIEPLHEYCEKKILYTKEHKRRIVLLKGTCKGEIRHQDVLGILFSLGLQHYSFGDVFIDEEKCYIFVLEEFEPLIRQVKKINKKDVSWSIEDTLDIKKKPVIEVTFLIPSYRLDIIISKLSSSSREKACDIIQKGLVLVNYQIIKERTLLVKENDVLSIRGCGKFRIKEAKDELTKKGNHRLVVLKYI